MSKPLDPKQPPMSMRESENLLRASQEDAQAIIGWKIFGSVVAILVMLVAFAYFIWVIAGSIGKFLGF